MFDQVLGGVSDALSALASFLLADSEVLGVRMRTYKVPLVVASMGWWFIMFSIFLFVLYYVKFHLRIVSPREDPAQRHYAPTTTSSSPSSSPAAAAATQASPAAARRSSNAVSALAPAATPDVLPGVTILKPMKGVDYFLEENLLAFFHLEYPRYELVLSVASRDDPARQVAEKLIKRFPNVDARLIVGDVDVGINPKINNMSIGYRTAKHPMIWISDSNVTVDRGCLLRAMQKMSRDASIGLMHQVCIGTLGSNFGTELERVYLGTSHARMYMFVNSLNLTSCVMGKSMLFPKALLDRAGGLDYFGQYLAEDNLLGQAIMDMGYRHAMMEDLVYQPMGFSTAHDFALRRIRWGRLRKGMAFPAAVLEPFTESIFCGLFASFGFCTLLGIHPLNFLSFHCCLWFALDYLVYHALNQDRQEKPENFRNFLTVWFVRELSYLPIHLYTLCGSTVGWRGSVYELLPGGKVRPYVPGASSAWTAWFLRVLERIVRHPMVVTLLSSALFLIRIFVEILYRSQRNGQPEDPSSCNPLEDIAALKAGMHAVVAAAALAASRDNSSPSSPTCAGGDTTTTTDASTRHQQPLSPAEIWNVISVGLNMHLQNERNHYEQAARRHVRNRSRDLGKNPVSA